MERRARSKNKSPGAKALRLLGQERSALDGTHQHTLGEMLLKEGIDADDGQDAGQRDVQKLLEAARAIDGGDFVQLFVHAGKRGATKPPPCFCYTPTTRLYDLRPG